MLVDEDLPPWKKRDRRVSSKMAQFMEEKSSHKSKETPENNKIQEVSPQVSGKSNSPVEEEVVGRKRNSTTTIRTTKSSVRSTVVASDIPITIQEDAKRGPKGFIGRGRPSKRDIEKREAFLKETVAVNIQATILKTNTPEEPPAKKRHVYHNTSIDQVTLALEPNVIIPNESSLSPQPMEEDGFYVPSNPVESLLLPKYSSSFVVTPAIETTTLVSRPIIPKIVPSLPPNIHTTQRKSIPSNVLSTNGNAPAVTIRFLKPKLQTLASCPKPRSSDGERMSVLKTALGITGPSSINVLPTNMSNGEKENAITPLQVHTNMVANEELLSQISPSIIALPNHSNRMYAPFEPNVRYCLVNQNGKLLCPPSELEENTSQLESLSLPSPPTHRFFEPCPNYVLTVL